jgi:hypothetical protein
MKSVKFNKHFGCNILPSSSESKNINQIKYRHVAARKQSSACCLLHAGFCLTYEELRDLYSSPSRIRIIKSRRMRWADHVARMEKRNAYKLLVGKPEGKRALGRPRRRWVDLGEVGWGDVDWIGLVEDRNRWRAVVNSVLNLQFR